MIIDTVRATITFAQREESTPIAPLDCDTSRRQSLSRRIHCRTSHASIPANSRENPIKIILKIYFSRVLPPRIKPSRIQSQTPRHWSFELVWAWFLWTSNSQRWNISPRNVNGCRSHSSLWNNCLRDQLTEWKIHQCTNQQQRAI